MKRNPAESSIYDGMNQLVVMCTYILKITIKLQYTSHFILMFMKCCRNNSADEYAGNSDT